ncbi:MAG: Ig-like domain-containing protein [Prevotellaceae bacterium]|jgi:uncharacterized protein YjdB|nr:Ig-like domain-containing protein [Prevotellaceae bacterium]
MKKVFLFLMIGLVCTISMTSCKDNDKEPGNVPLTGIRSEPEFINVDVRRDSIVVTVRVYPIPANATDVNFEWDSKNKNVAIIKEGEPGECQVTVIKGNITIDKADSTVVTVRSGQVEKEIKVKGFIEAIPVTGIILNVEDGEIPSRLPVGETVMITATPIPTFAENVNFHWKSSNEDVATVDQSGNVSIIDIGIDTITVSSGDISEKIVIEGY